MAKKGKTRSSKRVMAIEESGQCDLNRGDSRRFKSHKYMQNPKKFFWEEIDSRFGEKRRDEE